MVAAPRLFPLSAPHVPAARFQLRAASADRSPGCPPGLRRCLCLPPLMPLPGLPSDSNPAAPLRYKLERLRQAAFRALGTAASEEQSGCKALRVNARTFRLKGLKLRVGKRGTAFSPGVNFGHRRGSEQCKAEKEKVE